MKAYQIGFAAAKAAIACLSFFATALAGVLYAQLSMYENYLKGTEQEIAEVKRKMEEEKQKKIACGSQIKALAE